MRINLICEDAYFPEAGVQLLEENELMTESGTFYKKVFKTVLQEQGVKNQNGRIYSAESLKSVTEQLYPKAISRRLTSEMDHPFVASSDQDILKRRAAFVAYENSCMLIRDIAFDGRFIYGTCETLSTDKGKNLYALLQDNVNIGFSLRAFGSVKVVGSDMIVVPPIQAITYDVVSNPSHSNSAIVEFLSESCDPFELIRSLEQGKSKIAPLFENAQLEQKNTLTVTGDKVLMCEHAMCSIGNYEELIELVLESICSHQNIRYLNLTIN